MPVPVAPPPLPRLLPAKNYPAPAHGQVQVPTAVMVVVVAACLAAGLGPGIMHAVDVARHPHPHPQHLHLSGGTWDAFTQHHPDAESARAAMEQLLASRAPAVQHVDSAHVADMRARRRLAEQKGAGNGTAAANASVLEAAVAHALPSTTGNQRFEYVFGVQYADIVATNGTVGAVKQARHPTRGPRVMPPPPPGGSRTAA